MTQAIYIPQPDWKEEVKHKDGDTMDIIDTILYADNRDNHVTSRIMRDAANKLQDADPYQTLYNVWAFVKDNIKYKADTPGHEKIKDPGYLYHYGEGDCKSFSLMIGSILRNYKNIGFSYRFVSYQNQNDYSHVYVIAFIKGIKRAIIVDAVHSKFDDEVPYTMKKDYSMTKISHLHGIIRGANPSTTSVVMNDIPKGIHKSNIDITNKSQGELKLALVEESIQQLKAYYGDPDLRYAKALALIGSASRNLSNFNFTGAIDNNLQGLAAIIDQAKTKHLLQIKAVYNELDKVNMLSSISGPGHTASSLNISIEALRACIAKYNPPSAGWVYRQTHAYFEVDGNYYAAENEGQTFACVRLEQQKVWAQKNIFNTDNFRKGSHSMMYEFADSAIRGRMNSLGAAKLLTHQNSISAFAAVSGIDRDNIAQYVNNGIQYTSALNKFPDIFPAWSNKALSEGLQYDGQPGIREPITLTVALVSAIATAIISIINAVKSTGPTVESNLAAYGAKIGFQENKPTIDDFNKELNSLSNTNSMLPLLIGGAALGAYFLLPSKKKSNEA